MKIELIKEHSIRGVVEKSGTVHDIHDGVAQDLIDRKIAKKPESKGKGK